MRHSKSRLVEDADESAPVRLGNRTYRAGEGVYLFLGFTIITFHASRFTLGF